MAWEEADRAGAALRSARGFGASAENVNSGALFGAASIRLKARQIHGGEGCAAVAVSSNWQYGKNKCIQECALLTCIINSLIFSYEVMNIVI